MKPKLTVFTVLLIIFLVLDKFEIIFSSRRFFQKTNKPIRLYYLSTCFCSFFGRKWRHQKDISKSTDLHLSTPKTDIFYERSLIYLKPESIAANIASAGFFICCSNSRLLSIWCLWPPKNRFCCCCWACCCCSCCCCCCWTKKIRQNTPRMARIIGLKS